MIKLPIHVRGFAHVGHVEIAVVIVADILLPKARHIVAHLALGGTGSRMYQFETSSMPSGLACTASRITSFRMRMVSGIVARDHFIDQLHQLVRAQYFARVQAAVDPDHRLAFMRQRMRLIVGEPFGERQLARDFLVMGQFALILGRSNDAHELRPALFGLADLDQLHAIGLGGQLLPPGLELRVGGEVVIVADIESEGFLGRGDFAGRLSSSRAGDGDGEGACERRTPGLVRNRSCVGLYQGWD